MASSTHKPLGRLVMNPPKQKSTISATVATEQDLELPSKAKKKAKQYAKEFDSSKIFSAFLDNRILERKQTVAGKHG